MASMHEKSLPDTFPYPPIEPYNAGILEVGNGHSLYYEQCGQASGMPLLFLHGGPGSGASVRHRQLFDPAFCRMVLYDQRGCGRSRPRGLLAGNTSDMLVADIERLRRHLGIARWLVVGGSWGAALALAYAHAHPTSCLGLVLRGVFLGRASDLHWFFQDARQLLPDAWQALAQHAPAAQRADLLGWLGAGVMSDEPTEALACAAAWQKWESALSLRRSIVAPSAPISGDAAAALVDKYRLQSHYVRNGCFWGVSPLLDRALSLGQVPTAILHGRLDWICRPQAARELHLTLPGSRLQWLDGCGHSPFEPAMSNALAKAIAHFLQYGDFVSWGQDFTGTLRA